MTWATLHWRGTIAPKNAHLVHFKSISSSNYHDWDHTLHQIRYCVHDTLIGVLKVWNTKTWNALLRTFRGKGLSDTLVSLAPSTMRLCWYSIIKIDMFGNLPLNLSWFFPRGDGWHIVKTENQTWNLSKDLQDRRFQGKKFTQKTRNFRHLLNRDKKCVNALNWDKTSKKSLFYQFILAQHQ